MDVSIPLDTVDYKGAIHWIATGGITRNWLNPHTAGEITLTASSTNNGGSYAAWVDRTAGGDYRTDNDTDAWIKIDFGVSTNYTINPTHVTVRQRAVYNDHFFTGLTIYGSNDNTNWTQIGQSTGLSTGLNVWTTTTTSAAESYRYIRINRNGLTTSGGYYLCPDEIEIFGTLSATDTGGLASLAQQQAMVLLADTPDISIARSEVTALVADDSSISLARSETNVLFSDSSNMVVANTHLSVLMKNHVWDSVGYWGVEMLSSFVPLFGSENIGTTTLLGSATNTSTTITNINNGGGGSSGAFWSSKRNLGSDVAISFDYNYSGDADGFTVAFLSTTNYSTTPALGGSGGDLAMISGQGLYIEFRTWSSDGLWITPFGSGLHAIGTGYYNNWSGTHNIEVSLAASGALTVKLDGVSIHTGTYAKPTEAWIGVTGATGGAVQTLDVYNGKVY